MFGQGSTRRVNQSFLQYTWYLVNLSPHLFRRPPQELILTKKFITVWLFVLSPIYSGSILLKTEKRQLWAIRKLCDAGTKIWKFR